MIDVLCFGEPLVGFYPPHGSSVADDVPVVRTWGGDTSNVVIGVSRLGLKSAYLSCVGDDPFGKGFLKLWKDNGVDVSRVATDSKRNTGLYFVSFEGKRHILTYYRKNSAASAIAPGVVTKELVSSCKAIHMSGISLGMGTSAKETGKMLVELAREADKMISFDVNYRSAQWASPRKALNAIKSVIGLGIDVLEITDDEMLALGLGKEPDTLWDLFPDCTYIVLKKGPEGAVVMTSKQVKFTVSACPVTVRDTVGAGDSFDSGFLVSLLEGKSVQESAVFASAAAAHTCTGTGPLEKMPTKQEVFQLIDKSGYSGA